MLALPYMPAIALRWPAVEIPMLRIGLLLGLALTASYAFCQPRPLFKSTWMGYDVGTYSSGRMSQASDVGDLDADGDLDIVTANNDPFSKNWAVIRNDGAGGFSTPTFYAGAQASAGIALIDVEGDGDLDVARSETHQYGQGTSVSIYRNNGQAGFGARENHFGMSGPLGLAVGDYDADGRSDLAVVNWGYFGAGNTLTLLFGDANGSFSRRQTLAGINGMRQVVAEDYNLDGRTDLIVSADAYNSSQTKVVIFRNLSSGFAAAVTLDASPETNWASNESSCLDVADMDNDGLPDIIFSSLRTWNGSAGAFLLFKNLGNSNFSQKQYISYQYPSAGSTAIKAVDLNGDGWKDIVATQFSDVYNGGVYLMIRGSGGSYTNMVPYPGGRGPYGLNVADFDANGAEDIAATNYYSSEVTVHLTEGDGTLPAPRKFLTAPGGNIWIDFEDVDGDGDPDALTSGGYCSVLINQGGGIFGTYTTYNGVIGRPTGGGCLRDLNGDGVRDMLFADWNGPNGVLLYARWRPGLGDGTFGEIVNTEIGFDNPGDVDAADLDHDNDLDIVVASPYQNALYIGINDGFGNFTQRIVPMQIGAERLVFGDFNRDTHIDIAVCANSPYGYEHRVAVTMGNGAGDFGAAQVYNVDDWPMSIAAGDVNADGILDLATCNRGYENDPVPSVSVLLGNSNGTFQNERRILHSAVDSPLSIVIDDVDGDNKDDLLVSNESNDVSFFRSRGDGTFDRHYRFGIGLVPWEIHYKDMTGDGIKDVGTSCQTYLYGANEVVVLHGSPQPTSVAPTAVSMLRGRIAAGGVQDLATSNDVRLILERGATFSSSEAPIDFNLTGVSTAATPQELYIVVEGQCSPGKLRQTVQAYDFVADEWVTVRNSMLTANADSSTRIKLTNPSRFVQPGTNQLKTRVRISAVGAVFANLWQGRYDRVAWELIP